MTEKKSKKQKATFYSPVETLQSNSVHRMLDTSVIVTVKIHFSHVPEYALQISQPPARE